MRNTIWVMIFVIVMTSAVAGCGQSESARNRDAILRILRTDEDLAKKRESQPPNAALSQIASEIESYCSTLERLDMTDCPADFRVAYRHHMIAWREFQSALKQMPDGFIDGVLTGALNGLLRGEMDGGVGRMHGDLQGAAKKVKSTWFEVEKIGAQYGAAL